MYDTPGNDKAAGASWVWVERERVPSRLTRSAKGETEPELQDTTRPIVSVCPR